ncbi:B-cell receptor-associated protein 29 [Denticeps clupeoides]|uniref:Endoplasmic reticulum transmembrane protein n=1 Tax=Denticeps clupeoides TaxID=299321 RepID=A0AAY4D2M2_9TELE|nr:B-cell receptor-associated protein 29 [Denticeps clupeoides]XP_028810060.1 B-cell receptor-associated protein 29 [Denticeps clupeoides]XP_028810061.1 B-cell receptor-associated protein 29 [Denticeps clupeoides]XP_028810062.1 B-cell receptor-associated protein 29 [Denticeps clupeoides]XP_028810063.1 B-cell receptor-associated protein 29 [Denticeps clupeoides]
MTLQWTTVACFLYVEVGLLLVLCIPFISPQRWQRIFNFSIWGKVAPYWNKGFLTMIVVLIILFLDAVREVRKYSAGEQNKEAKLYPNMMDHLHMKLFRAQRNIYISGFSLFLWLVMRRVITLINQLATAKGTSAALQAQAESSNQAATKYMEDNELLKQALAEGKGKKATSEDNDALRKEVKKLTEGLRTTEDALKASQLEMTALRKQSEGLTREYDRLLTAHRELQNPQGESGDKKDN